MSYYERIREELEADKHKAKKKKLSGVEKDIKNLLRDIKFAKKLSKGDIESLNVHGDWISDMKQGYYQRYKKAVPVLEKHLEHSELSSKLRKQITEALS